MVGIDRFIDKKVSLDFLSGLEMKVLLKGCDKNFIYVAGNGSNKVELAAIAIHSIKCISLEKQLPE